MVYCENCGQEDLDTWEELPDGTIVCSEKCKNEWAEVIKANRKESGVMENKMEIEIYQSGDKEHQDSIWYNGDVAKLSQGDRMVTIVAVGEIRIHDKDGLVYDGKMRNNGIDGGLETDKDLKKIGNDYEDKYHWENNNWFEIIAVIKDGKQLFDGGIYHEYDSAIDNAKQILNDDGYWGKRK